MDVKLANFKNRKMDNRIISNLVLQKNPEAIELIKLSVE
jgi:hypothetical protein